MQLQSLRYFDLSQKLLQMEKIPLIPPLNVGIKLVTDFKEKARLFNEFFASKCTSITNDGSLPSLLNLNLSSNLSVINFTDKYWHSKD